MLRTTAGLTLVALTAYSCAHNAATPQSRASSPTPAPASPPPFPESEFNDTSSYGANPMVPNAPYSPEQPGQPLQMVQAKEPPPTSQPLIQNPEPPLAPPVCAPADWQPRRLGPLLQAGRQQRVGYATKIVRGEGSQMTDILGRPSPCDDSPQPRSPWQGMLGRTLESGTTIRLLQAVPAGSSGRGWRGNQCSYELRSMDGSGQPVLLGASAIPPFNSIYEVVRRGSAAWVGVQFNGYAREFPRGGCFVIAVDLCTGQVAWKSKDYTSNGDIVLIGDDYLLTGYGFTSEKRIVQVLDAHSGKVVQTLRIPGNPERLQFDQGVLTVQTNHGSAEFEMLH